MKVKCHCVELSGRVLELVAVLETEYRILVAFFKSVLDGEGNSYLIRGKKLSGIVGEPLFAPSNTFLVSAVIKMAGHRRGRSIT